MLFAHFRQLFQVVYYMDVSRDENRVIWLYIVVATMRDQLSVCPVFLLAHNYSFLETGIIPHGHHCPRRPPSKTLPPDVTATN